ncbi:MAG: hypothetical protein Q8K46_01170, partial [Deltaproteobacteria bacterium]|nr:hypothetical protein [Deltaproteobacteria bacterium]
MAGSAGECDWALNTSPAAVILETTLRNRETAVQRRPSVATGSQVHGDWQEAVISKPGSAATSMTGIE